MTKVSGRKAVAVLRNKGKRLYDDSQLTQVIEFQDKYYLVLADNYYQVYLDLDTAIQQAVKVTKNKKVTITIL